MAKSNVHDISLLKDEWIIDYRRCFPLHIY